MLRVLFLFLLFSGCVSVPVIEDTYFDENSRDWVEIYQKEIIIAIENEDIDSYLFFRKELSIEKKRQNTKNARN